MTEKELIAVKSEKREENETGNKKIIKRVQRFG